MSSDKGYCHYHWWARLEAQGAWFVTRCKRNARLQLERRLPLAEPAKGLIVSDESVRFANKHPGAGRRNHYGKALRKVVVRCADKPQPLVLATNDLDSSPVHIAQYYKQRWHIELLFKWLTQHLRIKPFLGRSENAVRIQIWCALITSLLLALYRIAHGITTSLWDLLAQVRATLFQRPAVEAALERRRRTHLAEILRRQPALFA